MRSTSKIPYIFTAALFIRAVYGFGFSWASPDSPHLINLALSIRIGSFSFSGIPETSFPMLYSLVISPFPTVEAALLVQAVLGSLTCALLYWIARNCRISTWGAWLYVFAPLTIHYTAVIMPDTLFAFLTVLALYFWTAEKHVLAGVVFGLAALTGPTVIPLLVFAVFLSLLLKYDPKPLVIITAAAIVVSLPWMVRNSLIEGTPTLTQRSAYRTNLMHGAFSSEETGSAEEGKEPSYPFCEKERDCGLIAAERITGEPFSWIKARFEQYPRLFIDTGYYLTASYPPRILLVLIQILVGIFALFGLRQMSLPLWIVPLFFILYYLPLRTEPQYFLSAVPFICLSAGIGLKRTFLKFRKPEAGAIKTKKRRRSPII
ncbi:MAG: hypothetical protein WKF92_01755 [Pyrinomonadaceae bacterium]